MTEDQAREKWCPMVRFHVVPGGYETVYDNKPCTDDNSTGRATVNSVLCIASDCMMWVQTDNECEPQQHYNNPTVPDPEAKCYPAGYCGLSRR